MHGTCFSSTSTDAWLDWDLENMEVKSTSPNFCCVPQTILEPLLQSDRVHYPAESNHCDHKIPFPWRGMLCQQQWYKSKCHEWQDPMFPSKIVPKKLMVCAILPSSHSVILVPYLPQVDDTQSSSHPHDVHESMIHQCRLPCFMYCCIIQFWCSCVHSCSPALFLSLLPVILCWNV